MAMIDMEKVQEMLNDKEFVEKARAAKTTQELQSIFNEYGMEASEEEIKNGYAEAMRIFEENGFTNDGELTEKALEMVSGGVWGPGVVFGIFVACGVAAGGALGVVLLLGGLAIAGISLAF